MDARWLPATKACCRRGQPTTPVSGKKRAVWSENAVFRHRLAGRRHQAALANNAQARSTVDLSAVASQSRLEVDTSGFPEALGAKQRPTTSNMYSNKKRKTSLGAVSTRDKAARESRRTSSSAALRNAKGRPHNTRTYGPNYFPTAANSDPRACACMRICRTSASCPTCARTAQH